ncbi:hypothetical protein H0H92_001699, partial [Tricholoma furcatifolium]
MTLCLQALASPLVEHAPRGNRRKIPTDEPILMALVGTVTVTQAAHSAVLCQSRQITAL